MRAESESFNPLNWDFQDFLMLCSKHRTNISNSAIKGKLYLERINTIVYEKQKFWEIWDYLVQQWSKFTKSLNKY
jgi:hypothetical protein